MKQLFAWLYYTIKIIFLYNNTMIDLNKIYFSDMMDVCKQMEKESVDIVIADPPYNIGKDFGNDTDNMEMPAYIDWCKKWVDTCIDILKPNGTMFIYGFSENLAYIFVNIPINKRWLVWHYTNKNSARIGFWQRSHESIIACWKNKPIFNADWVREPYTETFLKNAAGKTRKKTKGRFGNTETTYNANDNGALPRDVIKVPSLSGGSGATERWFMCKTCGNRVYHPTELENHVDHETIKHPTQKPIEITERLLKSAMPPKDGLVFVPFAGCGTECVVAKKLKMNFIGCEINQDYIIIANARLNENKYFEEQTDKNISEGNLFE